MTCHSDLRKAAELALEVLKQSLGYSNEAQVRIGEAKQALRQALAQPPCQTGAQCIGGKCPECEWVGLTDEEISECWNRKITPVHGFAREVEKMLKEKNT